MTVQLEALAQAGLDAISAAEKRGFERGLAFVLEQIDKSEDMCIVMAEADGELSVKIEMEVDGGGFVESKRVLLSELVYQQYPCCKGSTETMVELARKSLAEVDRIIRNWGKPLEEWQ